MNLTKRLMRSRTIFICLILIFIIYVGLNQYFLNLVGLHQDQDNQLGIKNDDSLNSKREKLNEIPKQIDLIRNRINDLQKSLDDSKKNADNLNDLMKKASSDLVKNSSSQVVLRKIAVLVFACNRPSAIDKHLKQLFERRESSNKIEKFPIIVSQDCGHLETAQTIQTHSDNLFAFLKQPDLSDIQYEKDGRVIPVHMRGYFKISRHYKFALEKIFMEFQFQSVIITEDDMNVSVDFFDYFDAMYNVMLMDSTIFCVSAWNDNGKRNLIESYRTDLVHRTDFFPGLGWMMLRSLWIEYRQKWPVAFWDDWVREMAQRKDRVCLRPEVPRSEVSGSEAKAGVSSGQFFDKFLKLITMNENKMDWSILDNSYLIKTNYDESFLVDVYNKTTDISFDNYLKDKNELSKNKTSLLLTYRNKDEFVKYAKHFGIMNDFKAGVPRTAYKGIVRIYVDFNLIFIAPFKRWSWSGYPKDW